MKLQIIIFFLSSCLCETLFAQDEILLKNGDSFKAKINEVGVLEVKYLKWENVEGPVYSIKKMKSL